MFLLLQLLHQFLHLCLESSQESESLGELSCNLPIKVEDELRVRVHFNNGWAGVLNR